VEVILNKIKSWKEGKKWYYKEIIDGYKNNESKYSEIFIKLSKIKSIKKCKKILEDGFEERDIRDRARASYLFYHLWQIIGTKENNKEEVIKWERYRMPSIRRLKRMMKKNNYKKIELRGVGFMDGYYMPVVKINRES